ncbi:uncharacterized protein ATNIH1004_011795 [Aspergillus tanneri]|uniref:Uncharacterized protein n=1 Tax=Aspergillus tanneri TaxID=1220188 RepID=A0A5M9MAU5_9EURO|nr:uncharacterized protein ATNIH1004_011795 [Aspergillus tanneri]KAA8641659.1 hypothetical protein ATNIH1004_011795 [Aspergillus tanneri]
MDEEMKQAIRSNLQELDQLVRTAGNIREVIPSHHKVLAVIINRTVQIEQQRVNASRSTTTVRKFASRTGHHLSYTLDRLTDQLWPDLSKEEWLNKREWLSSYSLGGAKWELIEDVEMILSLIQCPIKSYEEHGWKTTKIQALNAFIRTLRQFKIKEDLRSALDSIIAYYCSQENHQTEQQAHPALITIIPAKSHRKKRKRANEPQGSKDNSTADTQDTHIVRDILSNPSSSFPF